MVKTLLQPQIPGVSGGKATKKKKKNRKKSAAESGHIPVKGILNKGTANGVLNASVMKKVAIATKGSSKAKTVVKESKDEAGDEIDDLFGSAALAAPAMATGNVGNKKDKKHGHKKARTKSEANDKDELFKDSRGTSEAAGKKRRRTEEGYGIFSLGELNVGKGGGTALCPFDCECCH
eukprot:TRINITY_DN14897_c0_g1_i1.p2 TRINITY_DN14897_c0_g1~~TRINITY_DN14897_c0_g1_i1.p2  ORF type:complete len:178 (+),score=41.29 TRINITY_DN14897_c0_g1_i1:195-728(+)